MRRKVKTLCGSSWCAKPHLSSIHPQMSAMSGAGRDLRFEVGAEEVAAGLFGGRQETRPRGRGLGPGCGTVGATSACAVTPLAPTTARRMRSRVRSTPARLASPTRLRKPGPVLLGGNAPPGRDHPRKERPTSNPKRRSEAVVCAPAERRIRPALARSRLSSRECAVALTPPCSVIAATTSMGLIT